MGCFLARPGSPQVQSPSGSPETVFQKDGEANGDEVRDRDSANVHFDRADDVLTDVSPLERPQDERDALETDVGHERGSDRVEAAEAHQGPVNDAGCYGRCRHEYTAEHEHGR